MKFTPLNDWCWGYDGEQLKIIMKADNGTSYTFNTHFRMADLLNPPKDGQAFCIEDAALLTDYREGLEKLNLSEGGCLDLGINAVACARFVRPSIPSGRYFIPFGGREYFKRGSIVSVYTKEGNIGDCIVLAESDADNLVRLMLLNRTLKVGDGRVFLLGNMLRTKMDMLCRFRAFSAYRSAHYA